MSEMIYTFVCILLQGYCVRIASSGEFHFVSTI